MQTATVRLIRPPRPLPRLNQAAVAEIYRPLVVGCVQLERAVSARGEWRVPVLRNGRVWPAAWAVPIPAGRSARCGSPCRRAADRRGAACRQAAPATERLTLGLLCTADLRPPSQERPLVELQPCVADIYGWSLLYKPQRLGGPWGSLAAVDAHPDIPDLPAFYECPLELCDRLDFLDRRGVPARPLALVTRPEDFVGGPSLQPEYLPCRRNRFIPGGRFRPPADLSRLPGG